MHIICRVANLRNFLILTTLIVACTQESATLSVDNNQPRKINKKNDSSPMIIEGTIVEVMESWPLQLIVQTREGRYYVELLSETRITQAGESINQENLSPNLQVEITGNAGFEQLTMSAETIKIIK